MIALSSLSFLFLALLPSHCAAVQKVVSRDFDITKINEWPMIYSHDALTGQLDSTSTAFNVFQAVAAKTQDGTLVEQARCGARAFDVRPWVQADGLVVGHHGTAVVEDVSVEEELRNLVAWNLEHPNEFVLLTRHGCDGEIEEMMMQCMDKFNAILDRLNIVTATNIELFNRDYDEEGNDEGTFTHMTVNQVRAIAGEGMPLMMSVGCFQNNYKEGEGTCYKFTTLDEFLDFDSLLLDQLPAEETADASPYPFPLEPLQDVANEVIETVGKTSVGVSCYSWPGETEMREAQLKKWNEMALDPTDKDWYTPMRPFYKTDGHWQYTTESIILMIMSASSIKWDSQRSGQNKYIARLIRDGGAPDGLNLIGLDYVCEDGQDVKDAIEDVLLENVNIVDVFSQYMNGAAAGLKNGELKYTVPTGVLGLALLGGLFCCCKANPCAENSKLRREWSKNFVSFDSFAEERGKKNARKQQAMKQLKEKEEGGKGKHHHTKKHHEEKSHVNIV
ncbi:hypothetical protein TrLO_g8852 [Triparma laevis f. longispina]|uniref:PLC-like phosphodiesterase n=1 Tax=Triparma laevis f. longispina TaxID=1714387 RepID=A0A9W7E2D7_9STRA|nr:hypothetical protein TrLO_g8852 [Triparma laevis f. longispina]